MTPDKAIAEVERLLVHTGRWEGIYLSGVPCESGLISTWHELKRARILAQAMPSFPRLLAERAQLEIERLGDPASQLLRGDVTQLYSKGLTSHFESYYFCGLLVDEHEYDLLRYSRDGIHALFLELPPHPLRPECERKLKTLDEDARAILKAKWSEYGDVWPPAYLPNDEYWWYANRESCHLLL